MGNYVENLETMCVEIRTQQTGVIIDIVRELDRRRGGANYGQAEALTSHAANKVLRERYAADTADYTPAMRIRYMLMMPNTQPDPAARCLSDAITRPLELAYPNVEDAFMDAWQAIDSPDEESFPALLAAAYATAAGVILPARVGSDPVRIHMTSTGTRDLGATWDVICRCEWQSTGHTSQHAARVAGDAHLAEVNAS